MAFVGRTFTDMGNFVLTKVDEAMATVTGFMEQPTAVARQAISPLTSLLPSINEVRKFRHLFIQYSLAPKLLAKS